MESIAKYFKSSKKRDLIDGSKTSKELKKKTTSASSMSYKCDVFNDALDKEERRDIFFNCLKI